MHLEFPNLKINLTTIEKSGCTSLLNYFITIEKDYEFTNLRRNQNSNINEIDFHDGIKVHSEKNPYSASNYLVNNENDFKISKNLKILVIRDPFERFVSFWFDKVLLKRDPAYAHYYFEFYGDNQNPNIVQLQEGALKFLRFLMIQEDSAIFDFHYRPQYHFIIDTKYDLVLETKEIRLLPNLLGNFDSRLKFLSSFAMPTFNKSFDKRKCFFWNEMLYETFKIVYLKDIELYENLIQNESSNLIHSKHFKKFQFWRVLFNKK